MDNFQLQWDKYESNLATSFKEIREDGELFDITLACDDDQIEAHKMILSASSDFFRTIIRRNPHTHPLIYLKGVQIENLKPLLNFMYVGKTNVAQNDVETFLALGEELGVKGLVRSGVSKDPPEDIPLEIVKIEEKDQRIIETKESKLMDILKNEQEISNSEDVGQFDTFDEYLDEMMEESLPKFASVEEIADEEPTGYLHSSSLNVFKPNLFKKVSPCSNSELETQIEKLMRKTIDDDGRNVWQCKTCNRISVTKANLKIHVEIHMSGLSFSCKFCAKVFNKRNSLNKHMYSNTRCKKKRVSGV